MLTGGEEGNADVSKCQDDGDEDSGYLASVDPAPVDAPLEEAGAAVAAVDAVVLPGAPVAANLKKHPIICFTDDQHSLRNVPRSKWLTSQLKLFA